MVKYKDTRYIRTEVQRCGSHEFQQFEVLKNQLKDYNLL